ncbi:hypothetical protein ABHI18_010832, partial [Aspergillus niger]
SPFQPNQLFGICPAVSSKVVELSDSWYEERLRMPLVSYVSLLPPLDEAAHLSHSQLLIPSAMAPSLVSSMLSS